MTGPWFERLTQLDNSFLVLEDANCHMHVAAAMVFSDGPLTTGDRVDIQTIRDHVSSRIDMLPRYRQRLAFTPVEQHPVWVDDPTFNINYHVRHTSLPRPAGEQELKNLAARIMSQQLDRGKPLWEMWVVERPGHEGFAVISKTHHCMIDGVSGVDILAVLMSADPDAKLEKPNPWAPRPIPGSVSMARASLAHWASMPLEVGRALVRNGTGVLANVLAVGRALGSTAGSASATPVNRPIGPHRRFDYTTFRLADVKAVKGALGGTVNDVVLATVSLAVRRYLQLHRVRLKGMDFRVMAPVSMRAPSERGKLGNRVSAWQVSLPLEEREPIRVLERIRASTAALKESQEALGAQMLTQVTEWTGSTLLNLGAQLAKRTLPFNTVVTNIPGPQVPLYLCGSRLRQAYPMVPLFVKQGFGIALFSYDGDLHWGVNADWDVVPDLAMLIDSLNDGFDELCEAADVERTVVEPEGVALGPGATGRAAGSRPVIP